MILGFDSQFVPMVLDGTKTHTIRAGFRWKAGMRADLYTGGYQPGARRLLFRAVVTKVEAIAISPVRTTWTDGSFTHLSVSINGNRMNFEESDAFFYLDGFRDLDRGRSYASTAQAFLYWRDKLPFTGQLIHWDYERRFEKVEDTWRTCYRVSEWTGREARELLQRARQTESGVAAGTDCPRPHRAGGSR